MDKEHEKSLASQLKTMGPAGQLCGKLFDAIDVDGSGYLESAEAKVFLRCSGCEPDELEYYLDDLLRTADTNGDGKISKSEFLQYVVGDEPLDSKGGFVDKEHEKSLASQLKTMGTPALPPSLPSKTDTTAKRSKTRSALLGGLRSGKLEQAVSKMEGDVAAEEAIAAPSSTGPPALPPSLPSKTDTAATRSKTKSALLGGLRSGKLEQAVSKMEGDVAAEEAIAAPSSTGPPPLPPSLPSKTDASSAAFGGAEGKQPPEGLTKM